MKSSEMTRGFGAVTTLMLAGAAVLVLHSAAVAQQEDVGPKPGKPGKPGTKDAQKASPAPKAATVAAAEPPAQSAAVEVEGSPVPADAAAATPAQPAEELPPEYGPPPGYQGQVPGQQQPPPPPANYAPYQDPYYGHYGYPPPQRYHRPRYYPAPVHYYPQPTSYRPFFFGVGLGFGGVGVFPVSGQGESSSRVGMSYNLHFGFGVSSRWSIVLAGDGAFSYFTPYSVAQSVWSIGPQVFLNRHLYARIGIGVATKSIDLDNASYDYYSHDTLSDSGMGWTAAIGWEFMQSYHVALGLELAATLGHYQGPDMVSQSKNDGTIGLNFMLNLF
jgi:hypothetical protein